VYVQYCASCSICSKEGVTVAEIYRPPSSNMSQFYDDLPEMFNTVGDDIGPSTLVAISTVAGLIRHRFDPNSQLSDMRGLGQHVSDSTRTTSTTSCLLGLVVNGPDSSRISKVAVRPRYDASHHFLHGHVARGRWYEATTRCADLQLSEYEKRQLAAVLM